MKKFNALSITLLLVFLAFTVLQSSSGITKTHHNSKAVILLEDLTLKFKWNDEKKHPVDLQILYTLAFIYLTVIILLDNISRNSDKKFIFLLPVFYQSNNIIIPPELKS